MTIVDLDRDCLEILRVRIVAVFDDGHHEALVELMDRTLVYSDKGGAWGTTDFTGVWLRATRAVARKLDLALGESS